MCLPNRQYTQVYRTSYFNPTGIARHSFFKTNTKFFSSIGHETATDTDNDNDHPQRISINKTLLNTNNDLSIYSTSVASGASIETLKPSSDNLSSSTKSKPSSWADLFRGNQPTTTTTNVPQQSNPIQKVQTTSPQQNGKNNTTNNFHPKTNYHVYNSNGEDSRSLEGLRYNNQTFFIRLHRSFLNRLFFQM
jgi:hypothetical protein